MNLQTMLKPQVLLDDGHRDGALCIKVEPYNGRQMVRIGRFYSDRATGELKPGVKGFSVDANDFGTIFTALNAFVNGLRTQNGGGKPKGKGQGQRATA